MDACFKRDAYSRVCLRKVVNSRIYGIYDVLGINVIILLIVPIRKPR